MAGQRRPSKPRTPRRSQPPAGAPAPPVRGVRLDPQMASAPAVRSGAVVMAALWEE